MIRFHCGYKCFTIFHYFYQHSRSDELFQKMLP
ncbi:MAG: hypothetical protein QT04_C0048G0018 [archaeon GW2011_AR11]|nr:MAG: hypothetical protein QT04_C0048G0018 [archaeon GW2011_AR11]